VCVVYMLVLLGSIVGENNVALVVLIRQLLVYFLFRRVFVIWYIAVLARLI